MGERNGNPQIEDGYTKIANELLEIIYKAPFNATQLKIMLCVVRFTYGFRRKTGKLSISYIATAINRDYRNVQREINNLVDLNILISEKNSSTSCRKLGINKKYNTWKIETHGETAIGENTVSTHGETAKSTHGEMTVNLTADSPSKKVKSKERKEKKKEKESLIPTIEQVIAEDNEGMTFEELQKAMEENTNA